MLRILTGAAEAGFFPGVLFYLSCWFPAANRVRVLLWFLITIPLSSVVGGPLSVAIMSMDGIGGLKGWQWFFVLEGLPACICGLLTLWHLRDRLQDAEWLTSEERAALAEALESEAASKPKKDFGAAMLDSKVWLMTGILFSYWVGINGIAIWLPLILKGHGLSNVEVGFLSGLPYLIAAVAMIGWARVMERSGKHLLHLALACIVAGAGLVFSVAFDSLVPAIIGLVFAVMESARRGPRFIVCRRAIYRTPRQRAGWR
ncbi:MFS transporter [Paraburkholderia graminis]